MVRVGVQDILGDTARLLGQQGYEVVDLLKAQEPVDAVVMQYWSGEEVEDGIAPGDSPVVINSVDKSPQEILVMIKNMLG